MEGDVLVMRTDKNNEIKKVERENFLSSIYLIIKNENGEVLLQKRQGTKLWPGFLALPAGHIDGGRMLMRL